MMYGPPADVSMENPAGYYWAYQGRLANFEFLRIEWKWGALSITCRCRNCDSADSFGFIVKEDSGWDSGWLMCPGCEDHMPLVLPAAWKGQIAARAGHSERLERVYKRDDAVIRMKLEKALKTTIHWPDYSEIE